MIGISSKLSESEDSESKRIDASLFERGFKFGRIDAPSGSSGGFSENFSFLFEHQVDFGVLGEMNALVDFVPMSVIIRPFKQPIVQCV